MKILFITDAYPRTSHPNAGVFVYNLVQELVMQGHEVNVVAFEGLTLTGIFKNSFGYGSEKATVHRTRLLTASAIQIGSFNTYSITLFQKVLAVKRVAKKLQDDYDVIYCHFIESAIFGLKALVNNTKPVYVAVGENRNLDNYFNRHKSALVYETLKKVDGFIAVSAIIKTKLIDIFNVDEASIQIEPNGTDLSHFRPGNKKQLRKKYGFPEGAFIVVFVGRFLENKGPIRVLEAVKEIDNVKMIFIGEGVQKFDHPDIIFKKKISVQQMPEMLGCADVFILPTLHEGSNNAIIEAMSCGLPIVSSDIPEVRVQCTSDFSILVDPMDVEAIKEAVIAIKENPLKAELMSKKAREHANNFDLTKRVNRIISFMRKGINQ